MKNLAGGEEREARSGMNKHANKQGTGAFGGFCQGSDTAHRYILYSALWYCKQWRQFCSTKQLIMAAMKEFALPLNRFQVR